jgi:CHAD domain-containing protein
MKKVKRDLKRVADALGAARDQDVAIVALERLQSEAKDEQIKTGVGKLIEERRATRERAQLDLMETLAVTAIEDLQTRFTAAINEATKQKKSARVVSFNEAGRAAVSESLREFCDLSRSLYEPFNIEELHELRIAAKRLRYAIELFTACWGEKMAPFAGEIAEMQSFLGEVHDADVWIDGLSERLRAADDKTTESGERRTNVWLLSEFVKERTKNYRAALKLWSEWQKNDLIERMRVVVSKAAVEN